MAVVSAAYDVFKVLAWGWSGLPPTQPHVVTLMTISDYLVLITVNLASGEVMTVAIKSTPLGKGHSSLMYPLLSSEGNKGFKRNHVTRRCYTYTNFGIKVLDCTDSQHRGILKQHAEPRNVVSRQVYSRRKRWLNRKKVLVQSWLKRHLFYDVLQGKPDLAVVNSGRFMDSAHSESSDPVHLTR